MNTREQIQEIFYVERISSKTFALYLSLNFVMSVFMQLSLYFNLFYITLTKKLSPTNENLGLGYFYIIKL